jgi:tetratricopeptide (TPR) repeat protein
VADIFVSYTSKDREWAFWIGQELERLGHVARIDAWEIGPGGDIGKWMDERLKRADHVLCVISKPYLEMPHSSSERRAAQWAARTGRPNFALPVRIADCELPPLLDPIKRCDLYGIDENEARARLSEFLIVGRPAAPVSFPGDKTPAPSELKQRGPVAFPGRPPAISNIPVNVPLHFVGRDNDLAAIDSALTSRNGRAAVTALHGLRGVGKTVLAAAYAEQRSYEYRATWWIRAETESTTRADLVGLGVRLGWLSADAQEEPALKLVLDRLRDDGLGILLIYDNSNSARDFRKYAPRKGMAHIIVTSNAPDWRGVATPLKIEVWSPEVGADFLIERTGRNEERAAALVLSEALGRLPLAHEQAAAYCERLGMPLSEYGRKFANAPGKYLDDARAAPEQYRNGLTVSKTFALAIDEAGNSHLAAEQLIVCAALLAPEPIPVYLFSEGREKLGDPLAELLQESGLDEAIGALRSFALIDRESIPDERDPSITTDCIRLHRLVRQVASARCDAGRKADIRRRLIEAMVEVYPEDVFRNPDAWPRARRLDALAVALVGGDADLPEGSELPAATLLGHLDEYRDGVLSAYAEARNFAERALAIREKVLGPNDPDTASSLNNLAVVLEKLGDLDGSRKLKERALAIRETVLGPDDFVTSISLNNLGFLLLQLGELDGARGYLERALAIREKKLGPEDPGTALSLNNLGRVLLMQGEFTKAEPLLKRSLAIREARLGVDHLDTAYSANNIGHLLQSKGDLTGARLQHRRALAIFERTLGTEHPTTQSTASDTSAVLDKLGLRAEAVELRGRYKLKKKEK